MRCRKTASRLGSVTSIDVMPAPVASIARTMSASEARTSHRQDVEAAVPRDGGLDAGHRLGGGRGGRQVAAGVDPQAIVLADQRDQLATGALGLEGAVIQDADAVAEPFGLLHVVGRVEDRHALGGERLDGVEDRVPALRVDADGRLVEHQQRGIVQHAEADVQPALHATGERVGALVPPVGQADRGRGPVRCARPVPCPTGRRACRRSAGSPARSGRGRSRSPAARTRRPPSPRPCPCRARGRSASRGPRRARAARTPWRSSSSCPPRSDRAARTSRRPRSRTRPRRPRPGRRTTCAAPRTPARRPFPWRHANGSRVVGANPDLRLGQQVVVAVASPSLGVSST